MIEAGNKIILPGLPVFPKIHSISHLNICNATVMEFIFLKTFPLYKNLKIKNTKLIYKKLSTPFSY